MKLRSIFYGSLSLILFSTLIYANGSKGKTSVYEAHIHLGQSGLGDCDFRVELDPVLFQIQSVQNKYRVIRIKIQNYSESPLRLSLENDSVQVRVGSHEIQGSLNVANSDQEWWDRLSPELRRALAYPDQSPIQRLEEENIFAYFPIADLPSLPDEILYKVESVSRKPISLKRLKIEVKS